MEADKPWGGVWLLAAITADLLLCLLGNKFVDRMGDEGCVGPGIDLVT